MQGINQCNIDISEIEQLIIDNSTSLQMLSYTFLVDEENFNYLARNYNLLIVSQMPKAELILNFPKLEIIIKQKCTTKKKK